MAIRNLPDLRKTWLWRAVRRRQAGFVAWAWRSVV